MKITITESQAKTLNLITEASNPLEDIQKYSKEMSQKLNLLFNKLTNLTVYDVMSGSLDLHQIEKLLTQISLDVHKKYMSAYSYIENLPDEGLDVLIDDAEDLVSDKIASLEFILINLTKLYSDTEEFKLFKSFGSNEPMDITDLQS